MRPALLARLAALVALAASASAQPGGPGPEPVTVVVLGSSNAAGQGPENADSTWARRLQAELSRQSPGSRVVNLARGGYTTSRLVPTGAAGPGDDPDPAHNVTRALTERPDAIVISLTSNDGAQGVPVGVQLARYDAMLVAAGDVPVWITTPTPRTGGISPQGRRLQAAMRDSTLARWGDRAIDLWSAVADADGAPRPAYGAGDGVHFNARAHGLFAQRVVESSLSDLWATRRASAPSSADAPEWDVRTDWRADWVGPADLAPADTQNVWTAYRARFTLSDAPRQSLARVAVDSKYWLWVNGRLAVREGGLRRGPMRGATYADAVDLAPYLVPGENTVAVLVWTWGKQGFSHASTDAPGLLFDLDADGAPVSLDWRARVHPGYGDTGPPHPNYRLPESNVRYDARQSLTGWTTRGYLDSLWPAAVPLAEAGAGPWGALVDRPIPQWRDFGLKPYADAPAFPFVATGDTVVVSLPYNAQVTPAFEIDAPAGLTVEIRTDNYRGGGPPNVRAEYVTAAGRRRHETPGWMNGHQVRYAFPAGVTVWGLSFRETGYAAEFTGAFESSDAALDTLWQKAARTLYITMRDSYMDCPDRERAQWWGDVVLEMGETFYALDRRSDALSRKAILELAAWQRADSTLYSPVPSGPIWSAELPTQMLASVGHYGFWTYYLETGDLDTIRRVYPAVRDYLALWELDADGLVVQRPGGWTWGDWGNDKDMPLIFNGWYALALQGQRDMAMALGHTADIPAIEDKLDTLAAAFNERFWTGTAYRSPEHEGATDDRGHALAVVAGLVPPEYEGAVANVLLTERHSSPYFEKYVAEALIDLGRAGDALQRLRERYAEMIESDITTLWEGWELNSATYGGGTYNHAWSGGPLTLLSSRIVGVEPLTPGYATFRVAPQLGGLAHARAVVPSVRGEIVADVRQSDAAFTLEVAVPEGTEAELAVPLVGRSSARVVGADGEVGEGIAVSHGAFGDDETATFRVGPGRWWVVAE